MISLLATYAQVVAFCICLYVGFFIVIALSVAIIVALIIFIVRTIISSKSKNSEE